MTEQVADTTDETTPEAPATEQVADSTGLLDERDVATWRKRQQGEALAKQAAVEKATALEKELAKYRQAEQEQRETGLTEQAKLEQRLEVAERRAAEAEKASEARYLDRVYPNARKELPEVTDEVRLAKFEAMLRDSGEPATDTPRAMRAPRDASPSTAKEATSKDILAKLKTMAFDSP